MPRAQGEWIDRGSDLGFEFEGKPCRGFAGDSISSALAAAGVMTLGRSFKYHRRRGIFSLANHDTNNLFQVDGVPNVRGDVTPLREGMRVAAVNTVGGLERDRGRFIEWLAPFLPVGFYYKAFHGKKFPRWEQRIRAMSGLGRISADSPRLRTAKRYAFCDVLVIGAGPSGLGAALSAADAGARVLLVDENARPGGCGRWSGASPGELEGLLERVAATPNIELLPSTCAAGYYADHWVALIEPTRMTKVRAGAVVCATGVVEQPAVFRNNDLPGVLLGSAAQRLMHRYGIAPGRRVAILTANREGYELARELRALNTQIAAILDLRAGFGGDAYGLGDLRCVAGVVPEEAVAGRHGAVRALRVRIVGDDARPGSRETIACDAVLMSVGFAPAAGLLAQAGARLQYDTALQQHLPVKLPAGVFAAGRVNGIYDYAARRQDGRDAGAEAAAHARGGHEGARPPRPENARQPSHPYPVFQAPRARDFVDLDEDIQVKDLLNSVQEGFDSTELMKRFSTLGMGPSQGKHSNLHGARILMRARGSSLAETALTTQRPFYHPVPLKQLAGMGFHVERYCAAHDRHAALDAKFMTVGGWQRPEFYRLDGLTRSECIAREVRAVREGAGLIDVSTLGKIEIHGPDAGAFLDRVYAGSFSDLRVGMTRYGLLLDESGIVRDDGVIARLGEQRYYFTTTTSGAANVYRELLLWNARWRMDCAFVNATGHRAAFNLAGPSSRELLQSLTAIDLSEESFPFLGVREGEVAGLPARVLRAGFVSSLGFEIHVPYRSAHRLWDALMHLPLPTGAVGIRPFGVEAQRVLRLERGHAIVAQDTDALTNPFEAGLGWAVRMGKPFFVGQRSLRIHVRRGARQKLVAFELGADQPPGSSPITEANLLIHNGNIAGRVTSIAHSPTLGRTIGLAMAAPALSEPGSNLVIRGSDGRTVAARVVRTPFLGAA
ncbi:MAG TPA: 2Fe-2S iron-sulfur cluster-binding protein [Steroidobacteraceae bacterium]|nr:2Fe-2S iron-sulfur cluster-binding protein [Steroidobacteraceae bacterium]